MSTPALTPSPFEGEGPEEGAFKKVWRTLRTIAGDDAYERYCEHHRAHHPDTPPLDRRTYYVRNQQQKWSGINRCC